MRRARQQAQLLVRHSVVVVDIFYHRRVVARYDSLDGRHDEFVRQRFGQRRQEVFQIGRRGRQHHDVRFADRFVQVVRGGYAFPVEFRVAQIARVAALGAQGFQHFGVAYIPAYARFVGRQQTHDRRRPAPVADYGAAGFFSYFVFHAVVVWPHKVNKKISKNIQIISQLFPTFVRVASRRSPLGFSPGPRRC